MKSAGHGGFLPPWDVGPLCSLLAKKTWQKEAVLASSLRPTHSCPTLLCGLTLGTLALPCGKAQARLGTGPSSCVGFAYGELTAIPAVPGSREGLKWGVRKMREQPRGVTWHSCGSPPHK